MSTHTTTAVLSGGTLTSDLPLAVQAGSLTVDSGWSPYVQARMTVAADAVGLLAEPRSSHTIGLTLTETSAAGVVLSQVTTRLHLRSISRDLAAGTVELTASSAEALVQEKVNTGTLPFPGATFGGVREAIEGLVSSALHPAVPTITTALPVGTSPDLVASMVVPVGDPYWPLALTAGGCIGWQTWVGLDGVWRITPEDPDYVDSGLGLSIGPEGTVGNVTYAVTREDDDYQWADGVVAIYSWTDASGAHRVVGRAFSGDPVTRVQRVESSHAVTQAQADAYAASLRARALRRGSLRTIEAVSDYRVQPRKFIAFTDRTGTSTQLVLSTTWSLTDARMTLTTRSRT